MTPTPEYVHLLPGAPLPPLASSAPAKVVIVADVVVESHWQASVSDWLIRSGCLYMLAWGAGCSSWDDAVDMANLEQFGFSDVPEDRFVMTTWHEDEHLGEVFRFAKHDAQHPSEQMDRTLILHISTDSREVELLDAFAAA
ncbi:DUF7684 family protein [Curvibacter gracilis]|uniref:DUF7684 family protein n=1 Tax=Curvibacter gracilis TaxID=230310 RepID=UPI0004834530|nr:hypothetical protein [Curvibacter gracilis]